MMWPFHRPPEPEPRPEPPPFDPGVFYALDGTRFRVSIKPDMTGAEAGALALFMVMGPRWLRDHPVALIAGWLRASGLARHFEELP